MVLVRYGLLDGHDCPCHSMSPQMATCPTQECVRHKSGAGRAARTEQSRARQGAGPQADGSVKKPWDSQPRLKTPLILSDFRDAACDSPRFFHRP